MANLYLNELDWTLEEHGVRFVRYADDFLLVAKSKEDIERAAEVARTALAGLGLEVSMEKTRFVDFDKDDFNFVGFSFKHWRERKKDGQAYFIVRPTEASFKDFSQDKSQDKENSDAEQGEMAGTGEPGNPG